MVTKAQKPPRRRPEPLNVDVTVSFRFGDAPDDRVVVMQDQRIPLIGTVFDKRDAIVRGFGRLLVKAALLQPKVAAEFLPVISSLRRRRRQHPA